MNNTTPKDGSLSSETVNEVYSEHAQEELEEFIRQVVDKAIHDIVREFSESILRLSALT